MSLEFLKALDDSFDDGIEGKFDAESKKNLLASAKIPNGYYTLIFADESHRTFRVNTQAPTAKFAAGRRMVSLLIGPDNTQDYEAVAFLNPDGISVWKRFKNSRTAIHLDLLWDLMNGEAVDGCSIEVSKRCLVCNRTLTSPESTERGIGPSCWEKLNG